MQRLGRNFYSRDPARVAPDLLGRIVVFRGLKGRIVETEAYRGFGDPGSQIHAGLTDRNRVLLEEPGTIYIYLCMGIYYMFNIVCHTAGKAGGVLIRAVEVLDAGAGPRAASGPGKFTRFFGITIKQNRTNILKGRMVVYEGRAVPRKMIVAAARIGLRNGPDLKLRFYVRNSASVSKPA